MCNTGNYRLPRAAFAWKTGQNLDPNSQNLSPTRKWPRSLICTWTPGKLPPDQIPCRAFSKPQSAVMSDGKEKTKYHKVTKSDELWGPGNTKGAPLLGLPRQGSKEAWRRCNITVLEQRSGVWPFPGFQWYWIQQAVLKAPACPREIPGAELSSTLSRIVSSFGRTPVNTGTWEPITYSRV